jgi:hypothetical protein
MRSENFQLRSTGVSFYLFTVYLTTPSVVHIIIKGTNIRISEWWTGNDTEAVMT